MLIQNVMILSAVCGGDEYCLCDHGNEHLNGFQSAPQLHKNNEQDLCQEEIVTGGMLKNINKIKSLWMKVRAIHCGKVGDITLNRLSHLRQSTGLRQLIYVKYGCGLILDKF